MLDTTSTPEKKMDILDAVLLIEEGDCSEEEFIAAYQLLIDDGIVWKLQGFHGRSATMLIERGHCTAKEV